ncbi:MAG: hypothetical protein NTY64_21865 [Deltaproteobacteria bacterium]|nr:hypothetical protein [Deltaproteobacteria bacterium]
MHRKLCFSILTIALCLFLACMGASVRKELIISPDFQPGQYTRLAVISMDPQIQFSEYVEANLLGKGYTLKEGTAVRQLLKKEGFPFNREESFTPEALARIGSLLDVQGIILCSVIEFSRFRDAYRLGIKMINPQTGHTVWMAQGYSEGKKGQKSADLLQAIVTSSLQGLPRAR